MVVPQTGYYRVLQAYTAEGMSRVRVRVVKDIERESKICARDT